MVRFKSVYVCNRYSKKYFRALKKSEKQGDEVCVGRDVDRKSVYNTGDQKP